MILCYKLLMLKGGSFHHDLQSQILRMCNVLAAFSFLFVHDVRINLRGSDICMTH